MSFKHIKSRLETEISFRHFKSRLDTEISFKHFKSRLDDKISFIHCNHVHTVYLNLKTLCLNFCLKMNKENKTGVMNWIIKEISLNKTNKISKM